MAAGTGAVERREEFAEAVLSVVEQIPAGRVCTYGLIAEILGRGGPRQVGQVMAREGAAVPWWRVVRADGTLPDSLAGRALERHRAEGTPLRGTGAVDVAAAVWFPDQGQQRDAGGRTVAP